MVLAPLLASLPADPLGDRDHYFGSALRALLDEPCKILQGNSIAFLFIAWILFFATVALAFCGTKTAADFLLKKSGKLRSIIYSPWTFAAMMAISLAFCRWPAITFYYYMGLDENVMLAGALTLKHDPVFWRFVQSTTSGPVNYLPLLIPSMLGMPMDHAWARLICLGVEIADLFIAFKMFRYLMGDLASRLAILPIWCFWLTAAKEDFVQYTSETIPILILTLATCLAVKWMVKPPTKKATPYLMSIGFLLGWLPYAKMQSVPGGLAIALFTAMTLVIGPRKIKSAGELAGKLTAFIFSGVLPTLILLTYTQINHVTQTFWLTYVKYNLNFAASNHETFAGQFRQTAAGLFIIPGIKELTISLGIATIVITFLAVFLDPGGLTKSAAAGIRQNPLLIALICLLPPVFFWSIMVRGAAGTQWFFFHYYLFLLVPLTMAAMLWLDWLGSTVLQNWSKGPRTIRLVLICLPTAWLAFQLPNTASYLGGANYYSLDNRDPVALLIVKLTRPDDALLVWGWHPEFYVQTQLRQASSFASIERELGKTAPGQTQYYRDQFMHDVEQSQPRVIVDTTGPWDPTYTDRKIYGHEVFPEFTQYLDQNYKFLGEMKNYRIYFRKSS